MLGDSSDALLVQLQAIVDLYEGARFGLYQNDYTPVSGFDADDIVSADFSGYLVNTLGVWGAPYVNGDGDAQSDEAFWTFMHDGGSTANDIYGYFVRSTVASSDALFAERFAGGPIVMAEAGQTITIKLRRTLRSRSPE